MGLRGGGIIHRVTCVYSSKAMFGETEGQEVQDNMNQMHRYVCVHLSVPLCCVCVCVTLWHCLSLTHTHIYTPSYSICPTVMSTASVLVWSSTGSISSTHSTRRTPTFFSPRISPQPLSYSDFEVEFISEKRNSGNVPDSITTYMHNSIGKGIRYQREPCPRQIDTRRPYTRPPCRYLAAAAIEEVQKVRARETLKLSCPHYHSVGHGTLAASAGYQRPQVGLEFATRIVSVHCARYAFCRRSYNLFNLQHHQRMITLAGRRC